PGDQLQRIPGLLDLRDLVARPHVAPSADHGRACVDAEGGRHVRGRALALDADQLSAAVDALRSARALPWTASVGRGGAAVDRPGDTHRAPVSDHGASTSDRGYQPLTLQQGDGLPDGPPGQSVTFCQVHRPWDGLLWRVVAAQDGGA